MSPARALSTFADVMRMFEGKNRVIDPLLANESHALDGGVLTFDGVGSFMNRASGLGLGGAVSDTTLASFDAFYAERNTEPRIVVSPYADPSLSEQLAARGFTFRGIEQVYAHRLDDVTSAPRAATDDVEIRRLDRGDPASIELYARLATAGFAEPGEEVPESWRRVARKRALLPRFEAYVAVVSGEPVGAGGLCATCGSATLVGTSVAPAFRRRGVQTALLRARLARAKQLALPIAFTSAFAGVATERNAQRLGFFLAGVRLIFARSGEGLVGLLRR